MRDQFEPDNQSAAYTLGASVSDIGARYILLELLASHGLTFHGGTLCGSALTSSGSKLLSDIEKYLAENYDNHDQPR